MNMIFYFEYYFEYELHVYCIMLAGESKAKEIVVPAQWKTEDMEVLVPYVIASHLLYDLARVREDQTVLVLPPIGNI